jgi:hypothetical protein
MKVVVLLSALAAALPARASQAVAASVEDLARASPLVLRARVARVSARWSEDHRRIFTYVDLEPASAWRGSASGPVTVLVPGGEVGPVGQRVDGAPAFAPGEEVVVFLHRAEAGTHRVTGMAQGKFAVEGGVARLDVSHLTLVPARIRPGERRAEAMPLAELEARVRSVP